MNTFQGIERAIYEYLISHASELQDISAKTIANKALTTTTSVNRVCKKMGYASYTELRYKLANELRQQITEPSNETNLQQIIGVANTLKSSPVVYLYSRGASIVSVSYLSRFLSLANVPHLVITDIHQLTRAELGTLLLISKSGETNAVIEMAQNAKRKGLKVLGISHNGSTLDQVCHLNVALEEQVDGISLYGRESQIHTLQIIDQIGKELLTF
ncbi:MurR/RpiR family transcriptional regulator [Vibrio crassostreae]|uniref:MurR/RpiR family transcriptional regulator n=1 Tax=Vibrio crassostreae TaxID=246167 RepID=UPI000F4F1B9D|nr:MurR/RpiR family transcriptional regulator [Vibrio crassostreae]RPF23660.1 RpiR family transcriptional regulator [Vibrio crassostreae]CAK3136571.1 RpiR family transcriptional regulator [Vibrio crassostreae]CAK3150632.1 RpiR family transcriptional regulator [Vibrio crassostreae]CAK3305670.1 RpiR family transcriptional regulator [Vibrio crassostreae]CAK3641440.1 RpiR family transcriptional regulator [Vibrio crassostreae]